MARIDNVISALLYLPACLVLRAVERWDAHRGLTGGHRRRVGIGLLCDNTSESLTFIFDATLSVVEL